MHYRLLVSKEEIAAPKKQFFKIMIIALDF